MRPNIKTMKFYFSQAQKNYKRTFLVILIFSLSFSLLSSFSYGIDSLEVEFTRSIQSGGTPQISDINFLTNNLDIIDSAYGNDLQNEIQRRITPIEQTFRYATQFGQGVEFSQEQFQIYDGQSEITIENFYTPYYAIIGETQFYNSSRFGELFHLLEGNLPMDSNEIVIDYMYAEAYNYSVGSSIKLDFDMFVNDFVGFQNRTSNRNFRIVGIYVPLKENIQLGFYEYQFDYSYNLENQSITLLNRHPEQFGDNSVVQSSPILGFTEFSEIRYQPLLRELDQWVFRYQILNWVFTGFGVNLDFEQIQFNQIEQYLGELTEAITIIMESRESRITFYSYFMTNLQNLQSTFQRLRIIVPFLNLPLLIFAVVMGSMAIRHDFVNRMEEYILLRSRGTSIRMVRREILFEAFIQGLLSAIFGSLLGIPIFYGLRAYMSGIFIAFDISNVAIIFSASSVLLSFLISFAAVLFASLASLILISRLPISTIINKLKQNTLDGEIEENYIYKDEKEIALDFEEFTEIDDNLESSKPMISKKDQRSKNRDKMRKNRQLSKIYSIQQNVNMTPKHLVSLVFLGISIIPIIIIGIGSWGQNPNSPDIIFNFYENNKIFFMLSTIFVLFTPFFLTLAVIRFIGVERSYIMARISQKLTQPIMKRFSRILGLEQIRRRQYITLTMVMAVFISLIVFINIFLTSNLNIPLIEQNLYSGADANVQYSTSLFGVDPYLNSGNITLLENQLKAITNDEEESLVDDVLTLYLEVPLEEMVVEISDPLGLPGTNQPVIPVREFSHFMIYTNITKLNEFLHEDQKHDYTETLDVLSTFEQNISEAEIPNCVVSDRYLFSERKTIGDLIEIPHYYQNETLDIIKDPIQTRILESADNLPGLWLKSIGESLEEIFQVVPFGVNTSRTVFILMDSTVLDSIQYNLNNFTIASMLDLKDDVFLDMETMDILSSSIQNVSLNFNWVSNINYYYETYAELLATSGEQAAIFLVNYGFIIEFGVIGIIIAFSMAVLSVSLQKRNVFFNQLLLSRGIGKRGLFKFQMTLMANMFVIALVIGGLIGLVSGISLFKSQFFIRTFVPYQSVVPLNLNLLAMFVIISIIPVTIFIFNLFQYLFGKTRTIVPYQRDF